MKIIVISQMLPCKRHHTSGIFFANLLRELSPLLDRLTVVTPRPYIPRVFTRIKKRWAKWYLDPMTSHEQGLEIIRPYFLCMRGISAQGLNGLLMQYSLIKLIRMLHRDVQYDLVLGHNLLPDGIAAAGLAKKLDIPSVIWCIGSDVNDFARYNFLNHYLSRKSIETSRLVLTTSRDLKAKIGTLCSKVDHVRTFYRGIDVANFNSLPPRGGLISDLRLDPEKRYILFVGRIIYDKGIYELARSFSVVAKRFPNVDLLLVGEEIEREKLEGTLRGLGILQRVHFRGIIPYSEIGRYMKISEFLVLPTWAEGLPNVMLEAMAAGLPVVASNVGGIPEVLENEVTGLSCQSKDSRSLTAAMIRMVEDERLRLRCIESARQIVESRFDVRKNVLGLHSLLATLTDDRSSGAGRYCSKKSTAKAGQT